MVHVAYRFIQHNKPDPQIDIPTPRRRIRYPKPRQKIL
jgi:hypothetical protein